MKAVYKAALTAVVVFGAVCRADTIVSWNYNRYGDAYGTQSTDVAGVAPYSASYWNDTWLDGRTTDLLDNTGTPTTIDISWVSYNSWSIQGSHPGKDADGSYNKEILNGYLNSGPAWWNPPLTHSAVTLSQIPYSSYSIVVYFSSDVAGREGYVTNGAATYYFNTLGPASIASGNALFIQATDTTEAGYLTAANYAVFSGLSGTSQTVTVQMRDLEEWGGIAAVQLVVPEPASLILLSMGGLLLRRKK
ncbi:MAG TPA: PEP-CTERM sorting domain-containing protein [Anaerohalosphaeraceae bacterium]|nr:PEP-CTERM sorting domain-containing protein [Anaerohalosphaeraceae bacterium]HOL88435.1 PEP-CTERM sorting domain-containing protein [Anaerohalosphaeraceae bacterium]HPP57419.1 PEP-CTERM sorting domain-containing protein [Anaerohalosphaeraceae bacterium]